MKQDHETDNANSREMPDGDWLKVYAAVVLTTILVIAALWIFSDHFSR